MALHITHVKYCVAIRICFCIFFGKASVVMACHLYQWDPVSYLSLESLKVISQVSITSYFPTFITFLLAKTLYPVLIYSHLEPRVCWSSLPSTKVHFCHVMVLSQYSSSLHCICKCFSEFLFNAVLKALHFCEKISIMFLFAYRG